MANVGRQLTKKDIDNIKLMFSKGFNRAQIARIIGCSETTISRVRDGKHVLQRAENPVEEPKPAEIKDNIIEQKLDVIIGLLNEIKQAWS